MESYNQPINKSVQPKPAPKKEAKPRKPKAVKLEAKEEAKRKKEEEKQNQHDHHNNMISFLSCCSFFILSHYASTSPFLPTITWVIPITAHTTKSMSASAWPIP